ncbi:Maf family protein [Afipia clevelandensis]|uniref:Nucleoside triphosphate pyrophosphatase n=1 Tax=Afipia clevelandensis ATCC 49720 TaxID=883079 RepID=K8P2I4_9BRAD|nr:Maf family protein [Afipia clevelandensis]EKS33915.1 septum formation protein Maf [Afipia clevelandensis ATCC 49720]
MTIWRERQPLILASQSAVRKSLLVNAGIAVETMPADIDERGIQQDSGLADPGKIAALLAAEKAKFISVKNPGRYVVGADQTLALGERLFSKPTDRAAAAAQIRTLSGQMHALQSAVAVAKDGTVLFCDVSVARMTMRPLTDAEITAYLAEAGDAVLSSVGAYQLERTGVHLFARIEGDHFTILGLPLLPLFDFLRSRNLLAV